MTALSIRVPDELAERLNRLAKQTNRSKSFYVRTLLEDQLEDLEDCYLAMEVIEKVEKGEMRVWTQEEVRRGDDLEN